MIEATKKGDEKYLRSDLLKNELRMRGIRWAAIKGKDRGEVEQILNDGDKKL